MGNTKRNNKRENHILLESVSEFGLNPREWFLLRMKQNASYYRLMLKKDPTLEIYGQANEDNDGWISLNILDL